jgi:hypothetical protein
MGAIELIQEILDFMYRKTMYKENDHILPKEALKYITEVIEKHDKELDIFKSVLQQNLEKKVFEENSLCVPKSSTKASSQSSFSKPTLDFHEFYSSLDKKGLHMSTSLTALMNQSKDILP